MDSGSMCVVLRDFNTSKTWISIEVVNYFDQFFLVKVLYKYEHKVRKKN